MPRTPRGPSPTLGCGSVGCTVDLPEGGVFTAWNPHLLTLFRPHLDETVGVIWSIPLPPDRPCPLRQVGPAPAVLCPRNRPGLLPTATDSGPTLAQPRSEPRTNITKVTWEVAFSVPTSQAEKLWCRAVM